LRIIFTITYDGKKLNGFQKQPEDNIPTVQDFFEKALLKVFSKKFITYGCGRTDSGVHADEQTIMVDISSKLVNKITINKLSLVLNNWLPSYIRILRANKTKNNFHVRYSALIRCYRYKIILMNADANIPYLRVEELEHCYFHNGDIDINVLQKYFNPLEGNHDFSSFASVKDGSVNKKRFIYKIDLIKKGRRLFIDIYANGFLRSMVRSIIGNVLFWYKKSLSPAYVKKILLTCDPLQAKHRITPNALFLRRVFYTNIFGQ
jgi:tRNA pseudouridine38-40 synthase